MTRPMLVPHITSIKNAHTQNLKDLLVGYPIHTQNFFWVSGYDPNFDLGIGLGITQIWVGFRLGISPDHELPLAAGVRDTAKNLLRNVRRSPRKVSRAIASAF